MRHFTSPSTATVIKPERMPGSFPLIRHLLVIGIGVSLSSLLIWQSFLAGFAFLTLFVLLGLLWPRNFSPILAYCLGYQWLFVVIGYLYMRTTGSFPSLAAGHRVEETLWLMLIGLLVMSIGIRLAWALLRFPTEASVDAAPLPEYQYKLQRLFWLVMGWQTLSWLFDLAPAAIWFNAAQILQRLFDFRHIFLFILWLTILRRNFGYTFGIIAVAYTILPRLTSVFSSGFSFIVLIVFSAALSSWQPWSALNGIRQRSWRTFVAGASCIALVIAIYYFWQSTIKPVWRDVANTTTFTGSQVENLQFFFNTITTAGPQLNREETLINTVARMAAGFGYFTFVLDRVPVHVPHESGELTMQAIQHITMPRILFPGKPILGSDSWLVIMYAGVPVAGAEEGTSIGLGYMAQFYIDYGIAGMFLSLLVLGGVIGGIYWAFYFLAPSTDFAAGAATLTFIQGFTVYDANFAKMLGTLMMSLLIFGILLKFVAPWFQQFMVDTTATADVDAGHSRDVARPLRQTPGRLRQPGS